MGYSFDDDAEKDKAEVTVDKFGTDGILKFAVVGPVKDLGLGWVSGVGVVGSQTCVV